MNALVVDGLTVRFGAGRSALTAVDDVSLTVEPGTTVGIVGESGSGKSTLAYASVGLVTPQAGSVRLGGQVVAGAGRPRRAGRPRIQLVFQDPYSSLDPRMSVGEAIAEGSHGLDRTRRRAWTGREARHERVRRLLELVDLDPRLTAALPGELSGGMRQRVAVARALAAEPEVLIADEITSALDVSVQGSILNLLSDLQRELGIAVVFVSHNLALVRYVSDRIVVMRHGRVQETGPAQQLVDAPSSDYTRELLAAVPELYRRWEFSA